MLKVFSFRALTLRFCDRNGIRQLITCVHLPISIGSLPETIEKANQWEHLTDLKKKVKLKWSGEVIIPTIMVVQLQQFVPIVSVCMSISGSAK